MKNIKEVLTQLDPQLLMDIESSFCSIFKINPMDDVLSELIISNQALEGATYIVNPNVNSAHGNIFLDHDGRTLLKADFFANLISHIPLDFEYDIKNYTLNHPLENFFKHLSI